MKKLIIALCVTCALSVASASMFPGVTGVDGDPNPTANDVNKNIVQPIMNLTPDTLAKELLPALPKPIAGAGRVAAVVVEPVVDAEGTPNPVASGSALEKAITTAGAKGYHNLVVVDAGTYQVSTEGLTLPANITLAGVGKTSTIIKANSITSSAVAVKSVTIEATQFSVGASCDFTNVQIQGALIINAGDVTLTNSDINSQESTAVTVNGVHSFKLKNSSVTSNDVGIEVNNAERNVIVASHITAATTINITQSPTLILLNNYYSGGEPKFSGAVGSNEVCHGNIDIATGLPVPNYASGVTQFCQSPTGAVK